MKKRMRYYVRRGWICIDFNNLSGTYYNVVSWCKKTFKEGEWDSRVSGNHGDTNRFIFKNQEDAAFFTLKWINNG